MKLLHEWSLLSPREDLKYVSVTLGSIVSVSSERRLFRIEQFGSV
jgi:hypothetical protein